jgi:hypothetical protein
MGRQGLNEANRQGTRTRRHIGNIADAGGESSQAGAAGQGLNRSEAIRRLVDRTLRAALV